MDSEDFFDDGLQDGSGRERFVGDEEERSIGSGVVFLLFGKESISASENCQIG